MLKWQELHRKWGIFSLFHSLQIFLWTKPELQSRQLLLTNSQSNHLFLEPLPLLLPAPLSLQVCPPFFLFAFRRASDSSRENVVLLRLIVILSYIIFNHLFRLCSQSFLWGQLGFQTRAYTRWKNSKNKSLLHIFLKENSGLALH